MGLWIPNANRILGVAQCYPIYGTPIYHIVNHIKKCYNHG